jgi:hypothetical protein
MTENNNVRDKIAQWFVDNQKIVRRKKASEEGIEILDIVIRQEAMGILKGEFQNHGISFENPSKENLINILLTLQDMLLREGADAMRLQEEMNTFMQDIQSLEK